MYHQRKLISDTTAQMQQLSPITGIYSISVVDCLDNGKRTWIALKHNSQSGILKHTSHKIMLRFFKPLYLDTLT